MDRFSDIRPYRDDEVRLVIDRLLTDRDFIGTIQNLRFPGLPGFISGLITPFVRMRLKTDLSTVRDVRAFQNVIKTTYISSLIEKTIGEFNVSGLEGLDSGPCILMCNHRDIAMDPTLVIYAMLEDGRDSARIAIGDNLLIKPFASDLMRLNKCFIVKRSVKGRQALEAFKTLSAYIGHSIYREKASIWIAQREGRAKEGNDFTEPAIIKMLAMDRNKETESFSEYIKGLRIVPVAISYEYDPCDGLKAAELFHTAIHGAYKKGKDEDLRSIALGVTGYKGNVHISFGKPLKEEAATPESIASAVDRQIIGSYHLHPTNFFAYRELHGECDGVALLKEQYGFTPDKYPKESDAFRGRIDSMPEEHRKYALAIYANPVVNRIRIG